jgi:hypothetical protein
MEFGVHLPLISIAGEQDSLDDLLAFTEAARDLGYTHLCANDHLVFSRPWLDGPTALAAVMLAPSTSSGRMFRTYERISRTCDFDSSCSCFSSIVEGASSITSRPLLFLGKAMKSRILSLPPRIAQSRSNPKAIPPCGGAPRPAAGGSVLAGSSGGRLATSADRGRTWQLLKQDLPPIRSVAAARLA